MIFKVGKVKGYFIKTRSAVVKLTSDLYADDKLIFTGVDDKRFGQKNSKIMIENSVLEFARSGNVVVIVTLKPVKVDSYVFKNV